MTARSELPQGWCRTTLGELGKWSSGGTPKRGVPEYYEGGSIPWVKTGDLDDAELTAVPESITEQGLNSSSAKLFPEGTILVAMYGATIGKLAILGIEAATNQACAALLPFGLTRDLIPYIFWYLRERREDLRAVGQGGAQPNISQTVLKGYPCPLPPLNEQRRIVAKIEELTARSRNAKQALDAIPPLLERFRQSVLAAAFRGDLTKQWREQNPDVEPASELLKRIRQERRLRWEQDYLDGQKAKGKTPKDDKWKTKYKEPDPVDTTDLPELPEGWCWATMQEISDFDSNSICAGPFGTIFKAKDFRDEGIPIIFLRHVTPGQCRLDYKPGFMDTEKWEELFQPYSVYGGELLVTKLGDPPGVSAIFPHERAPAMVTPDVIKMTSERDTALNIFLMHYLNSDQARKFTFGAAYGVTRLRMNLTIFRRIPVPLAPFEEQKALAELVDSHLATINRTLEGVESCFERLDSLNQSILAKAFRGELVPQDPNDEPAPALLARLKAKAKKPAKR